MHLNGWDGPADRRKLELPQQLGDIAFYPANHFYGIAEDIEVVRPGHVELLAIDCINAAHFWRTLRNNRELFQVLENYHNAVTRREVSNRRALLDALLDNDATTVSDAIAQRCALFVFFPPRERANVTRRFPAGKWLRVGVTPKGPGTRLLWIPRRVEEVKCAVSRDLHSEITMSAEPPWSEPISTLEENLLTEIFSLNHLGDEPMDGGTTPLEPEPLEPLILSKGGFCIDGHEEFWSGFGERVIHLPDEDIAPYPRRRKAYCKPLKRELDVIPGIPELDPRHYRITLVDNVEGRRFFIQLLGSKLFVTIEREELVVEPLSVSTDVSAAVHAYCVPMIERC
jgi:hypothetical protein